MTGGHAIADEVLDLVNIALSKGEHWMAYNRSLYFIDKTDVYFFKQRSDADGFAKNNISDSDSFQVLHFNGIEDVLKQVPYGKALAAETEQHQLTQKDADANPLFNREGNAFTDALIDHIEEQQQTNILSLSNQKIMNQKNFDFLKDQVKYTGFGEGLENELKTKIEKQSPDFQIAHKAKFGNDDVSAVLHFKKSAETDMYFFNRYDVSLKPEQSKEDMSQTFYINKGSNITLKEAFNLMNGRAVNKDLTNKEDQVYNAWVQLDFKQTDANANYKFKQFHENYGYDINAALNKHPIKELDTEQDKTRLIESLQKGNRQSVTFMQNGSEKKQFIEANPQFKTINIYDSNMQRIGNKQGQDEKQGNGERQSSKQNAKEKQSGSDDSDAAPKASNKRKNKQTIS